MVFATTLHVTLQHAGMILLPSDFLTLFMHKDNQKKDHANDSG